MNSKKKKALILNIIIVVFEIIAFLLQRGINIVYYTQDSNLLALISSSIFVVYNLINLKNEKYVLPKWVGIFKYITTCSLLLTFLVVVFILSGSLSGLVILLGYGSMLFHHTLCPILAVISFICYEEYDLDNVKDNLNAVSFTIFYAIVIMILNIQRIVKGPYPFLYVYEQPVWATILWVIVILSGAFELAYFLRKSNRKVLNRKKE